MHRNRSWILWIALAFASQQAYSQATAPAPRKPVESSLPEVSMPESTWSVQLNSPSAGTAPSTGTISVLTVQLDTLKQVLAMAMSEEDVKKVVDFEDARFRKDDVAKVNHRKEVVVALMTRLKENCK